MVKRLLGLLIFFTVIIGESLAQTAPVLISSTDSVGSNFVLLNIKYVPNDTGVIDAYVEMQQGTGSTVYDSVYVLISHTVADTESVTLYCGPIPGCGAYTLLFQLSNDFPGQGGQGVQYNPLDNITIICTDIAELDMDNFKVVTQGHQIDIESKQLPPNSVAEIYDMTGRKIAAANLNQPNENIMLNTANGIYLLRIMSEGQMVYTSKLAMF